MKKCNLLLCLGTVLILIIASSCKTGSEVGEEPQRIENTIQSVTYFKDTLDHNAQELLLNLEIFNKAISEIGYPDAGYKLWIVDEGDTSEIRFMVQGSWPDKETYNLIHDHELFITAQEETNDYWKLIRVEYHRFHKVK